VIVRDIKFRAWDECLGKNGGFYFFSGPWDFLDNGFVDMKGEKNSWPEDMEQFTGLEDKNGREIYEGDILKADKRKPSWQYPQEIGHIIFDDRLLGWVLVPKDKTYSLGYLFSQFIRDPSDPWIIEIIGNIHQNKELLK
jgi:hypothetical protein